MKVHFSSALLITLLGLSSFYRAQNFSFDWAKQVGSSSAAVAVTDIATDRMGNVYTVGTYTGPVDFDPGPATYTLGAQGSSNVFISKLDSSGAFLWAETLAAIYVKDLEVSKSGNIYIVALPSGNYYEDYDPGPGTYTLTTFVYGTCILKLNSLGNFVWAKAFLGQNLCQASSLALDPVESVYVTGFLQGMSDLDPDTSQFIVNTGYVYVNGQPGYHATNFFLAKLDSNGKFVFARPVIKETGFYSRSTKVVINTLGEIVALSVYGQNPSSSMYKYGILGNLLWSIDCTFSPSDLVVDRINNISAVGYFNGFIDCDPGPGTYYLGSGAGGTSLFAIQLNDSGNFQWARRVDDWNGYYGGLKTATDASRNVYIAGSFKGTVSFDPSGQTVNPNSPAGSGFILRYDPYGNFDWVKQVGETSTSGISSIALDGYGNLYTAGSFSGTADFDPGAGVNDLTAFSNSDVFIHKLGMQQLVTGIQSQSSDNDLRVFPNPTNGTVYVQATHSLESATCKLTDLSGKIVMEKRNVSARSFALDLSEQAKGFYILEISDDKTLSRIKLVKE